MYAGIAHDFFALRALMRDARLLVAGTDHRTVVQHHGWRRPRALVLRNGHLDLGGFHQSFHIPQVNGLAGLKGGFFDALAIDERTIGRVAIPQQHRAIAQFQLAMVGGNGRMHDLEVVIRRTTDPVDSKPQFQNWIRDAFGLNEQFGHGTTSGFEP